MGSVLELAVAAFLIALNGLFSLSELAVVSARKVRLKTMADNGRPGAATALALAEDPGRFLSTVQIGITLIGVLAGAFSGAALGDRLKLILIDWGMPPGPAEGVGFGVVIGVITYLSVVVGELVPKNLALRNPEAIACLVAPLMSFVSRAVAPVVWLLDASTKILFRFFGSNTESADAITDEEIRTIVAEAQSAGSIEPDEQRMISGVLRLGDRAARSIMTPRTEVEWIDADESDSAIREQLTTTSHSRIPVGEGGADNMIGVVQVRELLGPLLRGETLQLRNYVQQAPIIPDTLGALDVLNGLREASVPMALVHDEYGHFEGVITPADILDAIAGAFRSDEGQGQEEAFQRDDGSWLIAGWMPVDEMADLLGLSLPERRTYDTAAGLVISELQHLPNLGEVVETLGWRFEVVDLDGRRVDKLVVSRVAGG